MITSKNQIAHQKVIAYFEESGLDYGAWSPTFNMHFGYFRWGMNPFKREAMLNQMNHEVLNRLRLPKDQEALVLDMGCGLGTTSRYMARHLPLAHFRGITITPWQVEFGTQISEEQGIDHRVQLIEADFAHTPLPDSCADAAFAMESACYANGPGKEDFVKELKRTLKPGGRFVVMDGFRKHSNPLPSWLDNIYQRNLKCWALEGLADINRFMDTLKNQGFTNLKVEDVSWKVAPSFAHIPFVSLKFLLQQWRKGERLSKERKNNVMAPLLGMLMGLSRRHFSYYIISGKLG